MMENRLKFFTEMGFATDNTLIQVTPLAGMLVSMTETTYWNYHDPYTLETLGQIDIKKAKNFPKHFFCVTNTAHPHFDLKTGDFWNVMGCLDMPSEERAPIYLAKNPFLRKNFWKIHLTENSPKT